MNCYTLVCILSFILFVNGNKETCEKLSSCKCRHSKGVVDLSRLSGKTFTVSNKGLVYSFFPCEQGTDLGGDCRKGENNAVCSQHKDPASSDSALTWGAESSAQFLVPSSGNYDVIMVKFQAGEKKVDIFLECPKNGEGGEELDFLQVQGDNLQLRLRSRDACYTPTHPSSTPTPSGKPPVTRKPTPSKRPPVTKKPPTGTTHTGAAFRFDLSRLGHWYVLAGCVSLTSLAVLAYVAVGMAYQHRKGARGVGLVPNLRLWKNVCGLFVDGFLFTFSCFPSCRQSIGVGTGVYTQIQNN